MLTIDRRSKDINILSALNQMVKEAATEGLPEFFAPAEPISWVNPFIRIDKEEGVVLLHFPTCQKSIKLQDRSATSVTDLLMAYDLDLDNDNGESFETIMKRYSIAWNDGFFYGAFEDAMFYYCEHSNLDGWVCPEAPTNTASSNTQVEDLEAFLNNMFGEDEPFYCKCCGSPLTSCECDGNSLEEFCEFCGESIYGCVCDDEDDEDSEDCEDEYEEEPFDKEERDYDSESDDL